VILTRKKMGVRETRPIAEVTARSSATAYHVHAGVGARLEVVPRAHRPVGDRSAASLRLGRSERELCAACAPRCVG